MSDEQPPGTYLDGTSADWLGLVDSGDPVERRLAVYALGEIGRPDSETVTALRERLEDPMSFVRVWAAAALRRVEPRSQEALATLVAATRDEQHFVRSLAAWMLARTTSEAAEEVIETLNGMLDDRDASVRAEATAAIERLQRLGRGVPTS
jgi:HEAT repeat protein